MRKLVAVIAMSGALSASPSLAADVEGAVYVPPDQVVPLAPVSGYLELYGEYAHDNYPSTDYNPWWGFGGSGRANIWITPALSTQFDFTGNALWDGYYPAGYNMGSLNAAAHLSYRDPTQYLLGGFVQLSSWSAYGDSEGMYTGVIGVEGQWYHNDLTLYAQAGWMTSLFGYYVTNGYDYNYSMWFAHLAGRYFFHDNTKVELSAGVMGGSVYTNYPDYEATLLTWNAEVEHRFNNTPFSVFARAEGFHTLSLGSDLNGGLTKVWTLKLGAKVAFGTATLKDEDRNGATLREVDTTPINWLWWAD